MSWSSDGGHTWKTNDCENIGREEVALSLCPNGDVIAATNQGVYHSLDSCVTWTQTSEMKCEDGISLSNGDMVLGTRDSGIALFCYHADSMDFFNTGLTDLNVHSLAFDDGPFIYAGTDSGIWRRPLTELLTSADPVASELPDEFVLHQNYPNPFNPVTTINYACPSVNYVRLSVFNVVGQEVAVLVSARQEVGHKSVAFDAGNLPSGVYSYRLTAGTFTSVKKMVLIK